MAQDALDHRGLLDERDEAQAPTTARARQNVEAEAATHEISPTWRRRPRRSHSAPRWRDRCVGLGGAGLGGARGLLGRWRVGGVGLARAGQGGPTRSRPTVGADGATLVPSWASLAADGPSLRQSDRLVRAVLAWWASAGPSFIRLSAGVAMAIGGFVVYVLRPPLIDEP